MIKPTSYTELGNIIPKRASIVSNASFFHDPQYKLCRRAVL